MWRGGCAITLQVRATGLSRKLAQQHHLWISSRTIQPSVNTVTLFLSKTGAFSDNSAATVLYRLTMDLKQALLEGYAPKSKADEIPRLFAALYKLAPVRLRYCDSWEGARGGLELLAEQDMKDLGLARGGFAATVDADSRRILVIPITMGFVVVRDHCLVEDRLKCWASPHARGLEGIGKRGVDMAFVLRCIDMSHWRAEGQSFPIDRSATIAPLPKFGENGWRVAAEA